MSVHTKEQLNSFYNKQVRRQGMNKLRSYFKTLKAYKVALVKKDKEETDERSSADHEQEPEIEEVG